MGKLNRFLLAAVLVMPILATGCTSQPQVNVWGPGESTHYAQWEHETHRDHVEWEQRNESDHNAYWEWRKHHN